MAVKIDIGCGCKHEPGFIRLDKSEAVQPDIICNLEEGIPLRDDSVETVYAWDVMEHIHNLIPLLNDLWRVCKHNAIVTIVVPHWACDDQHKDPTHVRAFTEDSASYWNRRSDHYAANGADYGVKCIFEKVSIEVERHPEYDKMPDSIKPIADEFWRNVKLRIYFTLRAVKEMK